MILEPANRQPLPEAVRQYLGAERLAPVWNAIRNRLERNGLSSTGTVAIPLDDDNADALGGLLGVPIPAGLTSIKLEKLDAALRRSAAGRGLVSVCEDLGGPLTDRKAIRQHRTASTASTLASLESATEAAGLAEQPWVPAWLEGIRRAGLLTRAGSNAERAIAHTASTLLILSKDLISERVPDPTWELAQLASECTGNAHGLDDGTLASLLMLRAIAASTDTAMPTNSAGRRALWLRIGVSSDAVSGTLLVWGLRPHGQGAWARMMRARADIGLVSHITMQEWLAAAGSEPWAPRGQRMWACENPQVLQAAISAGLGGPLLCFSGNPAAIGIAVIDRLVAEGIDVLYHGDFDVAGLGIASRLYSHGARPWRMTTTDYDDAARRHPDALPLKGLVPAVDWSPGLAQIMNALNRAVHEEAVLPDLLADLLESGQPG